MSAARRSQPSLVMGHEVRRIEISGGMMDAGAVAIGDQPRSHGDHTSSEVDLPRFLAGNYFCGAALHSEVPHRVVSK
jgi:hypothetical protein